jgi:hypothetical protein
MKVAGVTCLKNNFLQNRVVEMLFDFTHVSNLISEIL